jgi:hypothetical protein
MSAPELDKWGPKPPREITAERFHDMLNVLPPCKWRGIGAAFESFHVSERLSGNVVSWFCRLSDRYFQVDQLSTIPRAELERMVREELGRVVVMELSGTRHR